MKVVAKFDLEYQKMISSTLNQLEALKRQYVKGYLDEDDYIIAREQLLKEFD